MNKDKEMRIRSALVERLCELRSQAYRTLSGMKSETGSIADFIDNASVEANRRIELAIRTREMETIMNIQKTIDRIDRGCFGLCDACGGPISERRLMVKPETVYCRKCQEKKESSTPLKYSRPVLDRAA